MRDLWLRIIMGSSSTDEVASLQCSAAKSCNSIKIEHINDLNKRELDNPEQSS
jgi:hypothetical protein